jgi:thiamine kinase-like enzyme
MALSLEEAISRVPAWSEAKDLKATPLEGGITNNNFRIDVGGESFVLRISGANTELLGINRAYEYTANLTAGKLGIAPDVYFFIQPEGYLITRFIKGNPISPDQMRLPDNIHRVVDAVQMIHRMPAIPGSFNVFSTVRMYAGLAREHRVMIPKSYANMSRRIQEAEQTLLTHPVKPCPCHNDLLNANFLTNDRLYILDWEYAGMGDFFFDLANFSDHHNLSDKDDLWLLQCYFNHEPRPAEWAHLKIMKIMSDLREAAWGWVQLGISKLDIDFQEYADKFFVRVHENIQNPHWNEWLTEVTIND